MKKGENAVVRRVMRIPSYELGAMEEYLEKKAAEGLFFTGSRGMFGLFQKGEPRELRYCVDCFGKGSLFDTRAEEATLDYKEYCERAGWRYICTRGRHQFFCSEDREAVPIETDPKQRLRLIHVSSQGSVMALLFFTSLLLACWAFGLLFLQSAHSATALFEIPVLIAALLPVGLWIAVMDVGLAIHYLFFYMGNRLRLLAGKDLKFHSLKSVMRGRKICICVLAAAGLASSAAIGRYRPAAGLLLPAVFAAGLLIALLAGELEGRRQEERSRAENKTRFWVSIVIGAVIGGLVMAGAVVFCVLYVFSGAQMRTVSSGDGDVVILVQQDEIPYTLSDAGYTLSEERGYWESIADTQDNLFCTREKYDTAYYEYAGAEDTPLYSMSYTRIAFWNERLCKLWTRLCLSDEAYDVRELSDEAGAWGAQAVYVKSAKEDGQENLRIVVYADVCYVLQESMTDVQKIREALQ